MRPVRMVILLWLTACGDKGDAPPDSGLEADTDTDTGADADTDSDTDSDTDADTDSDTDSDSDTDLPDGVYEISDLDHAKVVGGAAEDKLGKYSDTLADTSGDGVADLLTGPWGPSGVWGVMNGPFSPGEEQVELDAWLVSPALSWLRPLGDLDGDGVADVASQIGLLHGPLVGELSATDTVAMEDGHGSDLSNGGFSDGGAGDVNGDGVWDILVAYAAYEPYDFAGAVAEPGIAYLLLGPATSTVYLTEAWASWEGDPSYVGFNAATGPGDVDGDGFDDVLLASEDTEGPDGGHGALYLVSGALSGAHTLADAQARIYSTATLRYLVFDLAPIGDVDGDGLADLLAATGDGEFGGEPSGAVLVFIGSLSGDLVATDADAIFTSGADSARFGGDVAAGDFDGDGEVDLAMSRGPGTKWDADVVTVFGPITPGVHDPDLEGAAVLLTTASTPGVGAIATGGDVDGDGLADLLASDYKDDSNGTEAGADYLIFGSSLAGIKP